MATIGLTNVIVESTIGELVRELWQKHTNEFIGEAINCHQCVGWWSGLLCSLVFLRSSECPSCFFNVFIIVIFSAFAGSFVCTFEKVVRKYLIEATIYTMCRPIHTEEEEDEH